MIEIKDKKECSGCAACANICPKSCIEMREDEEGFLYPAVNQKSCIKCNACGRVCPILNYKKNCNDFEKRAAIVQHKNREVCNQSTAGGAFTGIAEYTIKNGGVVFGVEMQADYSVRHIYVEKREELVKFRNSKYVQSKVGDSYQQVKKFLDSGRLVCFSGTPCQVEGLRHFLNKEYKNLILVDVVCRAVPSPGVWRKYIAMEIEKCGQLKSVRFRDKALGYQYSTMELTDENGKIYRGGIESQPWLRMFFSGMIIRPSCTDCRFRSQNRNSDFTIWDCFNVYRIDKKFDENIGTTRILIHTAKGKDIFDHIKKEFEYKEISVDLAVKDVQELVYSPAVHKRKEEFFLDFESMTMDDLLHKYFPETIEVKLKKYIRLVLNRVGLDTALKHFLKRG